MSEQVLADYVVVAGPHLASWVEPATGTLDPMGKQTPQAFHGFRAVRIPHLPTSESLKSAQNPDFFSRELFRRFMFLAETITGLDRRDTVALRILTQPNLARQHPRLEIWLWVKSARPGPEEARQAVNALWQVVQHAFPSEFPFNFPLIPVSAREITLQRQSWSPERVHQVAEIRKSWDVGPTRNKFEGFPHPYRHTPAFHLLLPLFSALDASPNKLCLHISLRPSGLVQANQAALLLRQFSALGVHEGDESNEARLEAAEQSGEQRLIERALRDQRRSLVLPENERARARLGAQTLDMLIRNQNRLLDMRITLANQGRGAMQSVVQALRATLGGANLSASDSASLYASPPEVVYHSESDDPTSDFYLALDDLGWFEHRAHSFPWQTLVTPEETASIFSLPVPSEQGQVPGMLTENQPFSLPVEPAPSPEFYGQVQAGLRLGWVRDQGIQTALQAEIPFQKITQHILVAGRSGSGKTNTCLQLILELNRNKIPFIILDPLDKRDYRLLWGDRPQDPENGDKNSLSETLRIYTLGDPASPFVFNPFRVPYGVTVKKHISQLLRCFLTAFVVSDPVPALYRAALRQAYRTHHWNVEEDDKGGHGETMPNFIDFFTTLQEVVESRTADYSNEVKSNIRQMTLLRIGSLMEETSSILNVASKEEADPIQQIVEYPTVLELGHIGSDEDKALIMAFLLACLVPAIQSRPGRNRPHVLLIEEAHRLMRRGGHANELRGDATSQTRGDFSNLLAEVRGYNQGVIVVDQSPSELVSSVFANTATHIMHQLRDPQSFEMMSSAFVLSPAQIDYARRLAVGEAITETGMGAAVNIYVPPISHQLKDHLKDLTCANGAPFLEEYGVVSNAATTQWMDERKIRMPEVQRVSDYEKLLIRPAETRPDRPSTLKSQESVARKAPPRLACGGCRPFLKTGDCPYRESIQNLRISPSWKETLFEAKLLGWFNQRGNELDWRSLRLKGEEIAKAADVEASQATDILFCYLVTLLDAAGIKSPPLTYLPGLIQAIKSCHLKLGG